MAPASALPPSDACSCNAHDGLFFLLGCRDFWIYFQISLEATYLGRMTQRAAESLAPPHPPGPAGGKVVWGQAQV